MRGRRVQRCIRDASVLVVAGNELPPCCLIAYATDTHKASQNPGGRSKDAPPDFLPASKRSSKSETDGRLLEKAWRLFLDSKVKRGCYDEEEHLWFRDEDFLPDRARTKSGRKVFWSRGNGWVLAGLARTLRTLGPCSPYFEGYRDVFVPMAEAICRHQSPDGFWRTSLLEPDDFPMPETSGTALDVLGLLIGYREELLGRDSLECALKGFEALDSVAVSPEGRIGWVQGVALKPGPVEKENTNDYAVGTYLLICRELSALL